MTVDDDMIRKNPFKFQLELKLFRSAYFAVPNQVIKFLFNTVCIKDSIVFDGLGGRAYEAVLQYDLRVATIRSRDWYFVVSSSKC